MKCHFSPLFWPFWLPRPSFARRPPSSKTFPPQSCEIIMKHFLRQSLNETDDGNWTCCTCFEFECAQLAFERVTQPLLGILYQSWDMVGGLLNWSFSGLKTRNIEKKTCWCVNDLLRTEGFSLVANPSNTCSLLSLLFSQRRSASWHLCATAFALS